MARIVFVLGGARSGKSEFAEKLLADLPSREKVYIATSRVWDEEVAARVRLHRERRPAEWLTCEYPATDAAAFQEILTRGKAFLFDCVTMYVNNLIMDNIDLSRATEEDVISDAALTSLMAELETKLAAMLAATKAAEGTFIFVSNELGLGIIPGNPISRIYRDLVGLANQRIAAAADEVRFVVCGIPTVLKRGE